MSAEFTAKQPEFAKSKHHESKCINWNSAALKKDLIVHFGVPVRDQKCYLSDHYECGRGRAGLCSVLLPNTIHTLISTQNSFKH